MTGLEPPPTSNDQALPSGTQIDSFRIESVLGTGGFGITYRAHDEQLECSVAIKEYFPAGIASRQEGDTSLTPRTERHMETYEYGLKRFLSEARTLAKFHEPSIVRVSRYLEANGTAYLVMDYEEGRSLGEVLRRLKRLNEQQATAVAVHILRGLRAVHQKKFLHRDIKPSNIFVRRSGPPVLLDFGAARMAMEQQTGALTIMLTPGYAPIEQYSGEEKQGAWSDLYALGATLYHCVAGRPPPTATERISAAHDNEVDPVDVALDSIVSQYSSLFTDAVRWMLRPHWKDRPHNAEAVLNFVLPHRGGVTSVRYSGGSPMSPAPDETPTILPPDTIAGLGGPRSDTRTGEGSPIDPEVIAKVSSVLAEFLGPISRVIVKRALRRAGTPEDLYSIVADELEGGERNAFLTKVK